MKTGMWRGLAAAGVLVAGAAAQGQELVNNIVTRRDPHDWTLRATVRVNAYPEKDIKTNMPTTKAFDFTSVAVVFPMIPETASSVPKPDDCGGKLTANDRVMDEQMQLLSDYPCGTKLGKWIMANDWTGQEVQLQATIVATCYKVKYDEAAATKLGWPQGGWPGISATCFTPQLFVEVMPGEDAKAAATHMQVVKDLVDKWMAGKDPKSLPPAQLAKFLCGQVLQHVQVSGNGLNYARTGEIEGLNLLGAAETAKRGRGSEYDMVALLAAVYRVAGLPARTVIGWDVGESKRNNDKFLAKQGTSQLRGWVEFALADPTVPGGIIWVPADVVRMRKSSTRAPALDRPWPFFGTNDEFDGVIPFSFQFHPPTSVVSHGSPAFWGWMVTPKPPDHVDQAVRFDAISTPKTADSQNKDKQDKQKKDKRKNPYGG